MLEFILGLPGRGKTETMLDKVKVHIDDKKSRDKIIIIVPEQSTLITEKLIFDTLSNRAFEKVEVLSFNRFAHRIFLEVGGIAGEYAKGGTKQIITNLVLANVENSLSFFKNSAKRPEFAQNIISLISDFKSYNVNSDDLLKAAEMTDSDITKQKLCDLALIYDAYDGILNRTYKDPNDDLTRLYGLLNNADSIKNTVFYFDLFLGFTPQEYLVIEKIIEYCKSACFCLSYDQTQSENDMFSMAKNTYEKLLEIARYLKIKPKFQVLEDFIYSHKPDIKHLESNYLKDLPQKCEKEPLNIEIYAAADLYEEIECVASQILKKIHTENYRYSDFLIIAKNQDQYAEVVDTIFLKYDIPVFFDKKSDIETKHVTAMIIAALEAVLYDFSFQSVFSYLKMSLSNLSFEETDLLENYALMWGIHSKAFEHDFYKSPTGQMPRDEAENNQQQKQLCVLNELRKKAISPLIKLKESINKDLTYKGICSSVYRFIEEINLSDNINKHIEELEKHGQLQTAQEYSQLYNLIIDVLDEIVLVLSDSYCQLSNFIKIFKLVLSEYSLGSIPASLDCVTFSNIERIASPKARCSIIIGANEGVLPRPHKDTSLFYDDERDELLKFGISFSRSAFDNANYEMQLIYSAIFSAKDCLLITYPVSSSEGDVLKPSYIINKIKSCFEKLEVKTLDKISLNEVVFNKRKAIEVLSENLNKDFNNSEDKLFIQSMKNQVLKTDDIYKNHYIKAENFNKQKNLAQLSFKDNLKYLSKDNMGLSASRIETFNSCKFSYFCRYILNAKTRKISNFDNANIGTFIHFVLEIFIKEAIKQKESLNKLSQQEIDELIEKIVSDYMKNNFYDMSEHSTRFKYIFNKIKNSLRKIIKNIIDELSVSSFIPKEFEFSIDDENHSSIIFDDAQRRIKLYGKVDRVDIYEKDQNLYIRVIDYKTGNKVFDLNDVLYGLNIQMLLYLFALINYYKNTKKTEVIGAGILYFHAFEPVLRLAKDSDDETISNEMAKSLKRNGLVLDDMDIIVAMENSIKSGSKYIPVSVKKDDTISKNSSIASLQQFEKIKRGIDKIVTDMAKQLSKGDIKIQPYVKNGFCYCSYCDFKSVCRFDFERGNTQKEIIRHNKEEIFEILGGDGI